MIMKHIFIVNPAAGHANAVEIIKQEIAKYPDFDCELYETTGHSDATNYIRNYCETHSEPVRFYACGGDGTINEVANGVLGFPQASMSCYPCGSGNDFVKYYGGSERFLDISALLTAEETPIDIMKVNDRISVNVTNFGFDTVVARTMIKVKKKPIIGGKSSYITGLVWALLTAMRTRCKVTADGELLNPKGKLLLSTVACGRYVGGAFCCSPKSDNTDGLLDVSVARTISRFTFIRLVGVYSQGKHLDDPRFSKLFTYRRAKQITVEAEKGFALSLDGEIVEGTHFNIEVMPAAIRFAVPKAKEEQTES